MLLALLEFLDNLPPFMTDWWFLILMALILAGLIGAFLMVRNKRAEDDE